MAFYRNPNCPYCGEPFTEGDDIVSCPDCGASHHRTCWQEHGGCARADRHGMPIDDPAASPAARKEETLENCPRCGYRNRPGVSFCSGCGTPFRANAGASHTNPTVGFDPAMFDPSINFSSESDFEDVPASDVARLVDKNTLYYMPLFARLRAGGRSRFNFAALLFGGGWMLFRKQYKRGTIMLIIQALLRIVETLLTYTMYLPLQTQIFANAGITDTAEMTQEQAQLFVEQMRGLSAGDWAALLIPMGLSLAGVILSIVIGFKANKWYYQDTLQKARQIRTRYGAGSDMTMMEEGRQGGTNMPLAIGLMAGASVVMYLLDFVLPLFLT